MFSLLNNTELKTLGIEPRTACLTHMRSEGVLLCYNLALNKPTKNFFFQRFFSSVNFFFTPLIYHFIISFSAFFFTHSLSFTGFFKQYRIKNIWSPLGIKSTTACLKHSLIRQINSHNSKLHPLLSLTHSNSCHQMK